MAICLVRLKMHARKQAKKIDKERGHTLIHKLNPRM